MCNVHVHCAMCSKRATFSSAGQGFRFISRDRYSAFVPRDKDSSLRISRDRDSALYHEIGVSNFSALYHKTEIPLYVTRQDSALDHELFL